MECVKPSESKCRFAFIANVIATHENVSCINSFELLTDWNRAI